MIVDVGIVGIVSDGSLKVAKRSGGIAHLHVHAGNLDQTLDILGLEIQTLLKVGLGPGRISNHEPGSPRRTGQR